MYKIVFFINTLSSGGAEHQLCELANGLAEYGYDVTITTFGDVQDHYKLSPLVKRLRIAPYKTNTIKMLAIWKYFLTVKTDWVISFGQRESRYCLEALRFRSRQRVHIIAGERNTTIGMPSIHEKKLMKKLYRRADFIVPNSYAQRKHIIEVEPKYNSKTITITNYTDLSAYTPTPLPNNDSLQIGVFGRYNPQKNCLRFVEAINILKHKTDQKFVIEWYGNQSFKDMEPNPHYVMMKNKVEENGLKDCILLNDHVKNVASIMPRFDAICLPSLWEGFSNSISEAICCGKPCLVSNVADNGVMVRDGVNGFLFDPKDENDIAKAFLKYFTLSVKEKQSMGNASRERAQELFDKESFLNAYIKLIESK